MGFLRGQAGMEYLSNYTITAVVVIIVIATIVYLGVLNPTAPDICIFQKGLSCDSHYLKQGENKATVKINNQFEDAIVIYGVICSGEQVNPGTGIPNLRNWNDPSSDRPIVNGTSLPVVPPESGPVVLSMESFNMSVYCYAENGQPMGNLASGERFKGLVFIRYRFNSSPAVPGLFEHVIQGNLQGKMN